MWNPFKRRRAASQAAAPRTLLDQPLLELAPADLWTIRDAAEGTQIFGGTGSGKTSGSGEAIARAFLEAGMGGLVLCVKADEPDLWRKRAAATGREGDLTVISAESDHCFNFLDYEMRRGGEGAGLTENIVALFDAVLEVGEATQQAGGDGQFWRDARRQLLRNAIDLIKLSGRPLTLDLIAEIIRSAPRSLDTVGDEAWREESVCAQLLTSVDEERLAPEQRQDFAVTVDYWLKEYPELAEKTRSVIVSSFTAMADGLVRGPLHRLFCSTTTVAPELTHHGQIIVLALPSKTFQQAGIRAQTIFKLLWQQATERRAVEEDTLPVFLWIDEAQFFITEEDAAFQTTARSARACTVYLTQNLPNYYRFIGDRDATESLLGNLQTKIFHANSCTTTNQWAADSIGRDWQTQISASSNVGANLEDHATSSATSSQSLEHVIQPITFQRLRKGGPQNDGCVDAIVTQAGRTWQSTGSPALPATFLQEK